jgi:hypothetical protein
MQNPTLIQNRIEKLTVARCGISRAHLLSADEMRAAIADRIGGVIAHRINFPKALAGNVAQPREASPERDVMLSRNGLTVRAKLHRKPRAADKVRPMLTEDEIADVKQTTAFALISTGALERMAQGERMSLNDWKVCFRAVRGADCLRIDRRAKSGNEILSIDSLTPEETGFLAARERLPELATARRAIIARKVRYTRAQCFAAFAVDNTRTRVSTLRKALRFVAFLSSQYKRGGAQGIAEIVDSQSAEADALFTALRVRKARFVDYLEKGERELTRRAEETLPEVRTLRSFAELPSLFAIAD